MRSREQIIASVRGYLLQEIVRDPDATIEASTPLLSSGIIDSIAFIALVGFIERDLGTWIPDDDLVPQSFETLDALADVLLRASAAQGAGR